MTPQIAAMLAVGLIGAVAVFRHNLLFTAIALVTILCLYAR